MKKLGFIAMLLLVLIAILTSCSNEIREFIATNPFDEGSYMLIKQDSQGVISEWVCYDENGEITAYIECKYEDIFMTEQIVYDANRNMNRRIVYEREADGKLINRKHYNQVQMISTEYFREENDQMSATNDKATIVRYDDLGRVIRMKSVLNDGSEKLVITEYDEFGLKCETTYINGEMYDRIELTPKK